MSDKYGNKRGKSNQMWGGRFSSQPDELMQLINCSIDFDRRLAQQDIAGSKAHAHMLAKVGAISAEEAQEIVGGLDQIGKELEEESFAFSRELEDIHMNIEARLSELIGEVAGKLHMARSRNDQVATDFRMWVRACCDHFDELLCNLQLAILRQAEDGIDIIMPGLTHLQNAQPVSWAHHLLAYMEMFARDRGRFADARARMNECPLGAAALAGTSFPIDRQHTADALEFSRPMANSMDAVSSRDFALEFLAACAICATNMSRLAEEIVLWASAQFNFISLSDAFATGSSIMPQKRNPDAAELVRAKTGRSVSAFSGLVVVLKALPLSYSKDMQEDKEVLFSAADSLEISLAVMAEMVKDMQPNKLAMRVAAGIGYTTATDLADWLVKECSLPFRQAHKVAGRIVALAEETGCSLAELPLASMQHIEPTIDKGIFSVLGIDESVGARTSYGGTAPKRVREQVNRWKKELKRCRD